MSLKSAVVLLLSSSSMLAGARPVEEAFAGKNSGSHRFCETGCADAAASQSPWTDALRDIACQHRRRMFIQQPHAPVVNQWSAVHGVFVHVQRDLPHWQASRCTPEPQRPLAF